MMAYLEIKVGDAHHITLVHFEEMDAAKRAQVCEILVPIIRKVKRGPSGTFGRRQKMGVYRNIKAILVVSPYLVALRAEIANQLKEQGVKFSSNFAFNGHVSHPLDEWEEGAPVPMDFWIDFIWKGHDTLSFEL